MAVATGDVNGDGKADLIWQHPASHEYGACLMPAKTWQCIVQGDHGAWKIVAVADVDGDDHDDLIWQNSTTTDVGAWLLPSKVWQWVGLGNNADWRVNGRSP